MTREQEHAVRQQARQAANADDDLGRPRSKARAEWWVGELSHILGIIDRHGMIDVSGEVARAFTRAYLRAPREAWPTQNTSGTGPLREKTHHVVRDFSTLPDLIKHAKSDLGATHAAGHGTETKIYFPRGDGQYEEASVWQKGNYWHAEGPGARQLVRKPPVGAKPITQQGARWASEAKGQGRAWPDWMILESIEKGHGLAPLSQERAYELIDLGYIDATGTWELTTKGKRALDQHTHTVSAQTQTVQAPRGPRYSAHQSEDNALIDFVFRGEEKIGYIAGPFSNSKGTVYKWELYSIPNQKSLPFGMSGMSGEARSRQAALNALTRADKALTTRRTEHFPETVSEAPRRSAHRSPGRTRRRR